MDEKDKILLGLAEGYEAGGKDYGRLDNPTKTEQRIVAELKAEGSIVVVGNALRFTDSGYERYRSRIAALRVFPNKSV